MLELKVERGEFTNSKTGEIVNYERYYVVVSGIKVYLKPNDNTSKQILQMAFNSKK